VFLIFFSDIGKFSQRLGVSLQIGKLENKKKMQTISFLINALRSFAICVIAPLLCCLERPCLLSYKAIAKQEQIPEKITCRACLAEVCIYGSVNADVKMRTTRSKAGKATSF